MNTRQIIVAFIVAIASATALVLSGGDAPSQPTTNGENENGKWPTIEKVATCVATETFRICYDCGKNANSVELYKRCCVGDPQTVALCNGDFSNIAEITSNQAQDADTDAASDLVEDAVDEVDTGKTEETDNQDEA